MRKEKRRGKIKTKGAGEGRGHLRTEGVGAGKA